MCKATFSWQTFAVILFRLLLNLLLFLVFVLFSGWLQLFLSVSLHSKFIGVQRPMTHYQTRVFWLLPDFLATFAQSHARFKFIIVNLYAREN